MSGMSQPAQYGISVVATAIATLIAEGFDRYAEIPNLSLIYVVPVVAASVAFGLAPALFCALLGALAYNFFFTDPRFTLEVSDTSNVWAIILLFVIGCITSAVASRSHRAIGSLKEHRRVTAPVNALAVRLSEIADGDIAIHAASDTLEAVFGRPAVVIRSQNEGGTLHIISGAMSAEDREAAVFSIANGSPLIAGIYPFIGSRYDFYPVMLTSDRALLVGVAFDPDRKPPDAGAILAIVSSLLGTALSRLAVPRKT